MERYFDLEPKCTCDEEPFEMCEICDPESGWNRWLAAEEAKMLERKPMQVASVSDSKQEGVA